ncbi:DNA gyrase subunit A [Paramaledivibacter caminithermalis]|uniref:DNA gyrase subunit A n=1 Tax=Paramaledivibacter caminithermalis (strain DSM 15212 / CIP 107654 / DViRD3) TaxID=1121301 RepID=A0A1M6NXP6_PARC5|nr:DNA gyrase subunit A [Paramaledivibacter caminithermalis]SHK00446.1 DNA gyrase subunit A [Paramaledivibacter caminithermalis DSM 15212]
MEENKQNIIHIDIADEMKKSYIDYAMSVIVGRALPDVRDGLKPVHRRILYAMNELGLSPDKPHRKSARIVGDVLGKYHPHGDTAVYDAMVRLAQDFSTRYMLVNGHGNFGSIDGDGAAAMRYTEAKLTKLSVEMLRDIDKETVDYIPNFDETLKEPTVLPSRYPNLLVNGSSGIAVGMATSIPPHNLGEIIDGAVKMIDDPDTDIEDIIKTIKGPDFPTGAIIMGKEAIKEAYRKGKGRVTVRSNVEIEDIGKGKSAIIVKEIPYQVNKAKMIEGIANLVRNKKIEGITDIRDESDRNGIRIVIELKKDTNANVVLNKLYKHSQMQTTFSIIMIALVDGQPKVLNLYEMLRYYLDHQKEVVTRRTQFDLNKAEARAHILEGLKIALDNIDAIINLIRSSKNVAEAKEGLMKNFNLTDIQAQAILDMRLQKLTGLEREKIEEEYEELIKTITRLREILANERLLMNIIKEELIEIKEKYNDKRRTKISAKEDEIDIEDLIDEEEVFITLTHMGYIKRVPATTYTSQKRGGKGISGLSTREEDFVETIFTTSTHNYILFFTNHGKVHKIKAYEIPEAKRQAKGTNIVNILYLEPNEKITAVIPIKEFTEDGYLVMATKKGMIKKSELSQFDTLRKTGLIAISLKDEDELISVKLTDGKRELILVTVEGMSIRFNENDVRNMGRSAMGVKAINLDKNDYVVDMGLIEEGTDLLVVSENGYGKRTSLEEYRIQSRGGKGIKTYNISEKTGKLVGAKVVSDNDEVMLINTSGIVIRLEVKGISRFGRNTRGVRLMRIKENDSLASIAKVSDDIEE